MQFKNKTIPKALQKPIEKALSFYPELEEVSIEFKYSENIRKSVMQAQPRFKDIFLFRKKRSYIIKIRRWFCLKAMTTPIEELPEDVLVGWFGHELGHILDYRRRNNWSILLFGIGYYTSRSFIMNAERVADTFAINQGLGDYILSTKDYILNKAGMSEKYISRIKRFYLPPEEVMAMMENRKIADD